MEINFGLASNGMICEKGIHHGVGEWTPGERAANFARIRQDLSNYYTPDRKSYLDSWEKTYGPLRWEMVIIGKNSGEFDSSRKGLDLYGAMPIEGKNYKLGRKRTVSSGWA